MTYSTLAKNSRKDDLVFLSVALTTKITWKDMLLFIIITLKGITVQLVTVGTQWL